MYLAPATWSKRNQTTAWLHWKSQWKARGRTFIHARQFSHHELNVQLWHQAERKRFVLCQRDLTYQHSPSWTKQTDLRRLHFFQIEWWAFLMNKTSTHYYAWLRLVVHELLPFIQLRKSGFANNPNLSRCLFPLSCSICTNWRALLKRKFPVCCLKIPTRLW